MWPLVLSYWGQRRCRRGIDSWCARQLSMLQRSLVHTKLYNLLGLHDKYLLLLCWLLKWVLIRSLGALSIQGRRLPVAACIYVTYWSLTDLLVHPNKLVVVCNRSRHWLASLFLNRKNRSFSFWPWLQWSLRPLRSYVEVRVSSWGFGLAFSFWLGCNVRSHNSAMQWTRLADFYGSTEILTGVEGVIDAVNVWLFVGRGHFFRLVRLLGALMPLSIARQSLFTLGCCSPRPLYVT